MTKKAVYFNREGRIARTSCDCYNIFLWWLLIVKQFLLGSTLGNVYGEQYGECKRIKRYEMANSPLRQSRHL